MHIITNMRHKSQKVFTFVYKQKSKIHVNLALLIQAREVEQIPSEIFQTQSFHLIIDQLK